MIRTRSTVAYYGINGAPTLTSEYQFTEAEQEVVDLTALIKSEATLGSHQSLLAPLHAVSVLPVKDPAFVEWVTAGMWSIGPDGAVLAMRPEYQAVLDQFDGWWG